MTRKTPHLCMIFEATGPFNAIGRIAKAQVEVALQNGWEVSVVAKRLCDTLVGRVNWLKLYVPRRGFAIQWLTARRFLSSALGDPNRFDVIHGHQPQIASQCDIFQCHFLTRVAFERQCLFDGVGVRRFIDRIQKTLVLQAEDYFYRRWNSDTKMVFVSELVQREFTRLYGRPQDSLTMENAAPFAKLVSAEEKQAARAMLLPAGSKRPVVGYLGGTTERKGYQRLIAAIKEDDSLHLLIGGAGTSELQVPELAGRFTPTGLVDNTRRFYAACDVLVVPSIFDPCPVVVLEAVSGGLPVIVTEGVGNAESVESHRAGRIWTAAHSLGELIQSICGDYDFYSRNAFAWAESSSMNHYCNKFLSLYQDRMARK